MKIKECSGEITFMHKIIEGKSNKSFDIHIAKLAGMPNTITERATSILKEIQLKNDTKKNT